jgi:glycosyltransferase involved in cell wall biosynthesis
VTDTWRVPDVAVLPVGVAVPEVQASRADLGLPAERFLALFVGRDVPTKGFDLLRAALDDAYEIVAVTDAAAGARPGLRTLPFMPADRLAGLMTCVDAFVLPSRGEGLPLSLQEAMAAGLPVVTTMLPGYEHFFDSDDVLVIEPRAGSIRNALRRLAEDAELRARLSSRSLAVAERHFSESRFVEAYERLYVDLAAG